MNPELLAWIKEHQAAMRAGDTQQAAVALGMIRSLNSAANQQDFKTAEAPMNPAMGAATGLGAYALGPPTGQAGLSYATEAGGARGEAAQREAENQLATYEKAQGDQPLATFGGEVGPMALDAASGIAALRHPRVLRAIARFLPKEMGGEYLRHIADVRELTPAAKLAELQKPITDAARAQRMLERTASLQQQTEANITRAAELHPERVKITTANAEAAQGRAKAITEKITDPRRGQARTDAYERMRLKTEMMRKQAEAMGVGVSPIEGLAQQIRRANPTWTMDQAINAAKAARPGLLGEGGQSSLPGLLASGAVAGTGLATMEGLLSPRRKLSPVKIPASSPDRDAMQQYARIAQDPRFSQEERAQAAQQAQAILKRILAGSQ